MKKALCIFGILLGISAIIAGICFLVNPAPGYSTKSPDEISFGADFYTYQYDVTRQAAINSAVTANNLRELSQILALYVGISYIFAGLLLILHNIKQLVCACPKAIPMPIPEHSDEVSEEVTEAKQEDTSESKIVTGFGDEE